MHTPFVVFAGLKYFAHFLVGWRRPVATSAQCPHFASTRATNSAQSKFPDAATTTFPGAYRRSK